MARSRHKHKRNSFYAPKKLTYLKKLDIAEELLEAGEIEEAWELLEDLHRHHPSRTDILHNLAYACHQLGDMTSYLSYCIKLCRLTPNDPDGVLALATAYIFNGHPALALRTYQYFVDSWPQHERAPGIRGLSASLESDLQEMTTEIGLTGEDGLETAEMHEQIQIFLAENRYAEGRDLAAQVIKRYPRFAPAYNNLSMLQFFSSHSAEAIATARQVLSFEPDNFQALANLIRFLFLSGEREEARSLANDLKALESENPDIWDKKMETFSFLCDDVAVLEAFEGAEKAATLNAAQANPLRHHLAAVAAWFTGKEELAKEYWQQALAISKGFEIAAENLHDLSNPPGERHGAWAYNLPQWLPQEAVQGLVETMQAAQKSDNKLKQAVLKFLEDYPNIIQLIPILLERSDPAATEFIIAISSLSRNPELLEAMKKFALGQRGSDRLRMRAAQLVCEEGFIPAGEIRMWMRGEWMETLLITTEISNVPEKSTLPPKAQNLFEKALYCLRDDNGVEAERLLNQVRERAPDEPSVLNNLAMAYKIQNRDEEYIQLVQQLYAQHPDYFFGCINMAEIYLDRGEIEKAREILAVLFQRKKMHVSEMTALCWLQILLELKAGRRDSARSWFDMFEKIDPEHPNLEILRARVYKPNLEQLFKFPFGKL